MKQGNHNGTARKDHEVEVAAKGVDTYTEVPGEVNMGLAIEY